jgi:hypothetical protein
MMFGIAASVTPVMKLINIFLYHVISRLTIALFVMHVN